MLDETPHRVQTYARGEVVFHQMGEAERIGLVVAGKVQGQKTFPNGSRVNVNDRLQGDVFGAPAAFSDARRYPCDIVAIEESTVLLFHRDAFLAMMQGDSRILGNVLSEISTSTAMLQQRLELYSYGGIAQKVAFWLLMRQRHTGLDSIELPGSMAKWAEFMNVSRPSLHREVKKMEGLGLIRHDAGAIDILDTAGLEALLDE